MVELHTNHGVIRIELDAAKAPKTVENFLNYVKNGFYDGTVFHRVINGVMVQGGGFEVGMKEKPTQAPIENDANNGLKNDKYTLGMARTNHPHS
ncbi:peptidylprolyl isomerase, partial [Pandoraea sputorum]|uniref:peptidylprolyl isomerase n=1 Tax=Pandoraea sputorum TaxID=93222 RepID=UPI003555DB8E